MRPALAIAAATLAVAASAAPALTIPFPQAEGSLTPYTFELGYGLMTLAYDTLAWRDADGVARPWLAESIDERDGGRRYVARLREGTRWHDGRRLTAADVAFTYRFVERRPHPRFTPQVRDIRRVRALDPRTIEFVLDRPVPDFLDLPLADVPILPRHLWRGLPAARRAPAGRPRHR